MKKHVSLLIATALYIGRIPGAPGTYASVATTLAFYGTWKAGHGIDPAIHLSVACLISAIGVFAAAEVSRQCGLEDPHFVVIDEVAGQLVAFLFLPVGAFNLIAGTVLFRVFDVLKTFFLILIESFR